MMKESDRDTRKYTEEICRKSIRQTPETSDLKKNLFCSVHTPLAPLKSAEGVALFLGGYARKVRVLQQRRDEFASGYRRRAHMCW